MPPIRIALCITDLDTGGAERCLTELAVRMDRQRFAPEVYCLAPRPTREEWSCVPRLSASDVPIHFLDGRTIWQFPAVLRRLTRLLQQHKPQVVTTFLFHANVLGRLAAHRARIGRVVCGIRVAEQSARWHLWLDRVTQQKVDRYVCVSRSVAEFSASQAGLPREKLLVIPNGIDLNRYPASHPADLSEFGVPTNTALATFIGRLEPQKGLPWLLETSRHWLDAAENVHLLLVGDGPDRPALESQVRELGLTDRVHFAGWRPDVPEILAASSILVLPSRWEGMPNVVLEAMASGKPVASTDVEGVCELLGPLASQQTVAYGDTQGLAAILTQFLRVPTLAVAMGAENRRRAEAHFNIADSVRAYEALWEDLARS